MNTLQSTVRAVQTKAAAQLETAAPRLTPKQRAARVAAREKNASARAAENRKRRTLALTTRRAKLEVQLGKAVERMNALKQSIKDTEAAIKATAKGH